MQPARGLDPFGFFVAKWVELARVCTRGRGFSSVALAPSVILLVTQMAEMGRTTTTAFFVFFFFLFSIKTSTAIVAVAVDSETRAAEAVVSPPASGTPPGHRLADDGPVAGGN